MFNIGMGELIVIVIVALFVFGPGKLPEVARAAGKGIREFRKAMQDVAKEMQIDEIQEVKTGIDEVKTSVQPNGNPIKQAGGSHEDKV